jgi:hypothetical protein
VPIQILEHFKFPGYPVYPEVNAYFQMRKAVMDTDSTISLMEKELLKLKKDEETLRDAMKEVIRNRNMEKNAQTAELNSIREQLKGVVILLYYAYNMRTYILSLSPSLPL